MVNSLLIGKLIYNNLSDISEVTDRVGGNIYPIVAPDQTTFPFIVYTRTNAYVNITTKDGYMGDVVTFQISVASDTYIESCEIANEVRNGFENCQISSEDLLLYNIRMTNCSETFSDDTYIQTLYFECTAE